MDMKNTRNDAMIKRSNNGAINPSSSLSVGSVSKNNKSVVKKNMNKNIKGKTPVKSTRVIVMKKKEKSPFPVSLVFSVAIITALFLFMIMNFAEIDRYNSEIAEIQGTITDLQNEAIQLEQKLNSKNNLNDIENYAKENGMVKSSDADRVNITRDAEDEGKSIKYDDGNESGLGVLLSGLGEVIKNFFK